MKWLNRILILSPVHYGLCLTEKDFHKELKRLHIKTTEWPDFISPGSDATTHHFYNSNQINDCCIVCIHKKRIPVHQVTSLLCHEAVHIWQKIKEDIGERYPSDEFEAYSIQAITQNLVEAYYEKGKKK